MRLLSLALCFSFLLLGCGKDVSDLQAFTQTIKDTTRANIDDVPKIEKFESFNYSVAQLRSPFVEPKPELLSDKKQAVLDCLQPNFNRTKQRLEQFPLDSISMRGTLGNKKSLYALAVTNDGATHRVKTGDYLGLFHGKVKKITSQSIVITEMVPDGTGCWVHRTAELMLSTQDA